ncbi:ABC transporter [Candidatus Marinamargulisbacteria bacterium SCGC AG-414-C22]|nr:ABC transporter [Candidatus Marinamargulisbacteria bacterium SCGC AG-414-C22]
MFLLFSNYTFQIVLIGTLILGSLAGCLGVFAVLRKQSLLGDCIAHAALPGICIAFLLTLTKSSFVLLLGAIGSGVVGTIFLHLITSHSHIKNDAALGIILSVFFGFGLFLLTYIQGLPLAHQSGLHTYLFGNASTILLQDVFVMGCIAVVVFCCVALFWKEFAMLTFDPDYTASLGLPRQRIELLLTLLIVIAIVVGLQTVGVVLMSALVIAPAVAARQWTDSLVVMFFLAGFFACVASVFGVVISSSVSHIPTGPMIVIVVSVVVIVSLFCAPKRGLIVAWLRHHYQRVSIHQDRLLRNLLLFSESMTDPFHAHDIQALEAIGQAGIRRILEQLKQQGYVYEPQHNFWGLTQAGYDRAQQLECEQGLLS